MATNTATIASLIKTVAPRQRERLEFILEPLQAILQIAFLSVCPIGSKLTIRHNILEIQLPTYTQGLIRWFQSDSKEDLFYIFNVFRRFIQNYTYLEQIRFTNTTEIKGTTQEMNLYQLLIHHAKEGLKRLIHTYNHSNNYTITHTLQIYESMLEHPAVFQSIQETPDEPEMNMDTIFAQIKDIYSIHELYIIYHSLIQLNKTEAYAAIEGVNKLLSPTYSNIQEWIQSKFRI
jgi:hypothetical protein